MLKYIKLIFISLFLFGCSASQFSHTATTQKEIRFRILPVKVEQTPNNWLFKGKFLESPFITGTDDNITLAGVLYIPADEYYVLGEVNVISEAKTEKTIYGHYPLMSCNNDETKFKADIKTKPNIHTYFEALCVKIKL